MGKKYDVVAVTGKYTNSQGEEKNRYMNCGVVIEKDGKLSMKLEGLPVGDYWNGWLSFFEPRQQGQNNQQQGQQQGQRQQQAPAQRNDDPFADKPDFNHVPVDDDIPFN